MIFLQEDKFNSFLYGKLSKYLYFKKDFIFALVALSFNKFHKKIGSKIWKRSLLFFYLDKVRAAKFF